MSKNQQDSNNNQPPVDLQNPAYTEEDRKVREQIKKKDYEYIDRMKKEMQAEEAELRAYFDQSKRKVTEDPTLRRKERYEEKIKTFNETFKNFQIFNVYDTFWNYQPDTPEEIETLNLCKRHIKKNLLWTSLAGLAVTSITSYRNRVYLGYPMIGFGVFVGLVGGGMFGLIRSTEYVLKSLSELGPEYSLGRLVTQQIEEYRLDKNNKLDE